VDNEKLDAIRRLGAPPVIRSLVELGRYFENKERPEGKQNAIPLKAGSGVASSLVNTAAQSQSSPGAAQNDAAHPQPETANAKTCEVMTIDYAFIDPANEQYTATPVPSLRRLT
jgi:hypothetical protein